MPPDKMMKTIKAYLLIFIFVWPHLGWAWAESCPEEVEAVKDLSPEQLKSQYGLLLDQLDEEFEMWRQVSNESITKSLECFDNEKAYEDCSERLFYFFNTFPEQLHQYRQNLALSHWDTNVFKRVFLNKIDEEAPFNWKLRTPGPFYRGHVDPLPMEKGSAEFIEAQEVFQRKISVDFRKAVKDFDPQKYVGVALPNEVERQRLLLENQQLYEILINPMKNRIARQVLSSFSDRVFSLNKKRLVKQLIEHPLLAMVSAREVTKESLVEGLLRMKENLDDEYKDIDDLRVKIRSKLKSSDQEILSRDFFKIMDYTQVSSTVVMSKPELCPIVKLVDKHYAKMQWIKTGLLGVTFVGMMAAPFLSVPLMAVLGGSVGISGYMVYQANDNLNEDVKKSFVSPEQGLNLSDSGEIYSASEDLKTETAIAAFTLVSSVPLYKTGSAFKYFLKK